MMNAFRPVLALLALLLPAGTALAGTVDLPRYPAASPDGNVVLFSWRGDIWKVPGSGGGAVRLTASDTNEGRSAFSPDGSRIVFDSDRDGGRNLFIMNSDGSDARQLTFGEAGAILSGTGVDGAGRQVAFFEASRENDLYRATRPYLVPLDGGPVERAMDCFGSHPVATKDGGTIVFERGGSTWTRRAYQGPDQRDVWTWNRADGKFTRKTEWAGNDGWAFPAGDDLVWVTDRGNGRSMNLWRKPMSAGPDVPGTQLTNFDDDIRELSVSADGRTAYMTVWDALWRLDLSKPDAQPVKMAVQAAEDEADRLRPRNVGRDITEAQLSPDGKVIALVAYGDVYVKGLDERSPFVRVTRTPAREREIAWMPDGAKLLFSSDSDGNDSIYEATVAQTRAEVRAAFKERTAGKKDEAKKDEDAKDEPTKEEPKADEKKADDAKGDDAKKDEAPKADAKPAKKEPKRDEGARWADAVRVDVKPLVATGNGERSPSPSPDGKKLAYRRDLRTLVVRDVASGEERDLRTGFDPGIDWRWSPDSTMLAVRQDDDDFNSDIWIQPVDAGWPAVNVTRHPDADGNPRWSADGKVLAFTSSRVNNEQDVYLVFLDKELEGMQRFELDQYFKDAGKKSGGSGGGGAAPAAGSAPSGAGAAAGGRRRRESDAAFEGAEQDPPAAAKADEPAKDEPKADEKKPEEKKADDKKVEEKKPPFKPADLADAYRRLRRLTTMPGNEADIELAPSGATVYFMSVGAGERGSPAADGGGLMSVAWSGGEPKKVGAIGSIQQINAAGDKLVVVARGGASIVGLPGGDAKPVELSDTVEIDLRAQSAQKFGELSRIMGMLFYNPTMNGTDWPKLTEKWGKLAANARTDEEFDYVANRYIGELNASHLGVRSPAGEGAARLATGRLGVRTKSAGGGFEITEILPDSPVTKGQTPLAVGDVIVAVNGVQVDATATMESLFRGTVGKETVVTVRRTPAAGGDAVEADAILVPVSSAEIRTLTYDDTLRRARETVDRLSGGRVGYIHIQGMDQPSLDDYERDLYAAAHGKDGLIIDVRNNGGGWTADRLLSSIMVQPHAYTIPRGGDPARKWHYPVDRLFIQRYSLPINMLVNEKSFSNAEITAHAFRTLKRGTLVGQQSYGGVISTGSESLIDGTTVRTPGRGWYLPDGTDMEMHGAMPDIVVPQTPEDESTSHDTQLETAVADLMKRLGK
jgi:tricorn protease